MAEKTKEYRLRYGKHSYLKGGDRVNAVEGDMVPLTADQYAAFRDKFEDTEAGQAKVEEGAGGENKSQPAPSKTLAPSAAPKS